MRRTVKCLKTSLIIAVSAAGMILAGCAKTDGDLTKSMDTIAAADSRAGGESKVTGEPQANDEPAESDEPAANAESEVNDELAANAEPGGSGAASDSDVTKEDGKADSLDKSDLPKEDMKDDWKTAYMEVIKKQQDLITDPEAEWDAGLPTNYLIYDIDKNGIPEMIIGYGSCEADYHGTLYNCQNGKAVPGETFSLGHTSMYSVPNENGILFWYGHMGAAYMEKAVMKWPAFDRVELLSENIDEEGKDDYTQPAEVVDGAIYLSVCPIDSDIYITHYEEITQMMQRGAEAENENPVLDRDIEKILPDILDGNGTVICVSADGYSKDMGEVPMNDLLANLDEWSDDKYVPESIYYYDINDDGVEEGVIRLIKEEGYAEAKWCILSLQDGDTYAYIVNYQDNYSVKDNGVFVNSDEFYAPYRVIFAKKDCMVFDLR